MGDMEAMEFRITDSHALQSANLCKYCLRTLNVPPIYCIEDANDLVTEVCGRCYHIVHKHTGKKWRQHAYENIARFLTFPCVYKKQGCDSVLKWDEVEDHEAVCLFRIVNCPASDNDFYRGVLCSWEGKSQFVATHLQETHQDLFVDPPHFEEFPKTSGVYFTQSYDTVFMIVFLHEGGNRYYCCVFVRGSELDAQLYRYQVELIDSTKTNSIILRRNKLENWINIRSILCNKDNLLELDCDIIENLVKNNPTDKRISVKFGIVKKSKKEMKQIYEAAGKTYNFRDPNHRSIPKQPLPDEDLLAELECPICNEFMVPPIYICSNGHSLCDDCLRKIQSCPNCRCSLGRTRNFTLENLTTKVIYPCKNREAGCDFVTNSQNIRDHENSCNLMAMPCPLKCGSSRRKAKMWTHITEEHADSILEMFEIYELDIPEKTESHYIVHTSGELFRFSVKGSINNPYKFNMQLIGYEDEPTKQFKFSLEIIDKRPSKLNITIVSLVQDFNDTPFTTNTVSLPWVMMKPFVIRKGVHFKFGISEIKMEKNADEAT